MGCVVFSSTSGCRDARSSRTTPSPSSPPANADVAIAVRQHRSDPRRRGGARSAAAGRRGRVRGLKLHPPLQQFFPNDRVAYPLYEVFAEARLPVLFHTGHSGIGTGMPGGGGIRLKYGHPMPIDDVAVDFPDMPIIMAHPSFPWQDEAISICLHKPQVYIDLSGWSPKYFSPTLVQYANTLLKHKVLFGSDYPLLTPDRWLADFEKIEHSRRSAAADPERERDQAVWVEDVRGAVGRCGRRVRSVGAVGGAANRCGRRVRQTGAVGRCGRGCGKQVR